MSEQKKLSDGIMALDKKSRSENLSFKDATSRAEKLYSDNARAVANARSRLRSANDSTRKFTDKSLDTLAAKRYFNGKLKAQDYLAVYSEQGKQAVQKFLKAA